MSIYVVDRKDIGRTKYVIKPRSQSLAWSTFNQYLPGTIGLTVICPYDKFTKPLFTEWSQVIKHLEVTT